MPLNVAWVSPFATLIPRQRPQQASCVIRECTVLGASISAVGLYGPHDVHDGWRPSAEQPHTAKPCSTWHPQEGERVPSSRPLTCHGSQQGHAGTQCWEHGHPLLVCMCGPAGLPRLLLRTTSLGALACSSLRTSPYYQVAYLVIRPAGQSPGSLPPRDRTRASSQKHLSLSHPKGRKCTC